MSFRQEIKDFTEGMKAGQEYWQRAADTKYREAQWEKIRPMTDKDREGMPGVPKAGDTGISETPQASQGDGGKVNSIKRTGDDEYAARRDAIASIESSGNYRAVGSQTKSGDRAYGRYQIMGANIPAWTKQVLGRSMTPGEFLADQDAQDQVFDVMFDDYVGKYGHEGAAQAWLGGPGSVGKTGRADMHGTTVGSYGQRFAAAYKQFGGTGTGGGDTQVAGGPDYSVGGGGGVEVGGGTPKGRRSTVEEDPNYKPDPPGTEYAEAREQGSTAPAIEVVEARPAQVGTPQVQTAFFNAAQPQAGGLSDPRDQEVRPTLFAAAGGAIPEPDKYNPARGYTQAIPQPAATSTPTAVTTTRATATTQPTSYLQRWKDMRAARATQAPPAAAAAPVDNSYAQQLLDWQKKAYPMGRAGANSLVGPRWPGNMPKLGPNASAQDQLFAQQASAQFRNDAANWQNSVNRMNQQGSHREAGGMVYPNFAEGGAIPEPGEAFARGGSVKDVRSSAARGRSYQVPSGSARGESAAYTTSSPGWRRDQPTADDDEPYFRPRRKPLPPSGIAKITTKAPPRGGRGKEKAPPTPEARPDPELAKAAGTPTAPYEPKARAAGTPTAPYEPKARAAGTPTAPYELARAAGTPTEGYEPKARAAGTPTEGYERVKSGPFPARPEVHPPGTWLSKLREEDIEPTGPNISSKREPDIDILIPPDPDRFGPRTPAAAAAAAVRAPVRLPANTMRAQPPAPAIPEPQPAGTWINGQWVPFNTTADPGTGFARGGKVDRDVRSSAVKGRSYRPTFANSRADSAGYTTSSPGWRRDEEFPEAPVPAARSRPPSSGGGGARTTPAIPVPTPRPTPRPQQGPPMPYRGQPPAPQGVVDLPEYGSPPAPQNIVYPPVPKQGPTTALGRPPAPQNIVSVPQVKPAAIPDPYTLDVTTGAMDPGATGVPRYALGGAVPDDEDQFLSPRADSAGYTSSAPGRPAASRAAAPATPPPSASAAEESPKADVEATPHLLSAVSQAVQGGARFLSKVFGLDGRAGGAVPTPEAGAQREEGIRRFASNEGAMTPDEIKGIDDAVDPNRELSEGDRQMNRFAQTMNWYLERGRKDDAEAAAAGLMQYGAQRFGRLGSMSGAAYKKYLETKDPKDLEAATKFLSKAYEMVPDGAQMAITIDPETHMLQATRVGADGNQEVYDISPGEIPGLIQQTMNQSGYWKQIFTLADPTGAHQEDAQAEARRTADVSYGRDEKKELRKHGWDVDKEQRDADLAAKKLAEQRAYTETTETKTHIRDREEKLADEKAAEARARRQTLLTESLTRTRPDKTGKPAVDAGQVASLLDEADSVQADINALDLGKDDPVPPDLQEKLDNALSRLYDASGQDEDLMTKLNYPKANWRYRGAPPVAGARKAKDGNWYKPDPARPGKWIKLTETAAAAP